MSRNSPESPAINLPSLSRRVVPLTLCVLALTGLTLILRTWNLNSLPPWLWWDEATQGLDARTLLQGHFRVFFPSALGKEPLYIYLTTPFVAAWDGQPFAVRVAGALLGALMVPTLYCAGRALWPKRPAFGLWAGVAAAGFWATNFWPQSINRIGFQVNPFPLIFTLAVVTWQNYVRKPTRRRAIIFGLLAGLTLTTYIVARSTPLLWVLLYVALPRAQRQALRGTLRWAVLTGCLAIAPLSVHFALHPGDFFSRVGSFDAWRAAAQQSNLHTILWSVQQWIGGFLGLYGDPLLRHNVPYRPPFSPALGALFALGFVSACAAALRRRDQAAITLLAWWVVPGLPFLATIPNAPHFTRLFGALPPALLLAASPIGWIAERLRYANQPKDCKSLAEGDKPPQGLPIQRLRPLLTFRRGFPSPGPLCVLAALLTLLLIVEGVTMIRAYFVTWAQDPDLYAAYQGDTWRAAERIIQTPGAIGVIPLDPGYGYQLDYLFPAAPIHQFLSDETDAGAWLAARLSQAGGKQVMTPVWSGGSNPLADARHVFPFYLEREGVLQEKLSLRGFDLLSYRLGEHPQFGTGGQRVPLDVPFPPDMRLIEGRWGAAYPNPDRDAQAASAGTAFWAVLTWQADRAQPDVRIAVDLVDGAGHRLVSSEMPLMDTRQRETAWSPGKVFNTYHLITVPGTQPMGPISLDVRAYDTRTLEPVLAGANKVESSVALGEGSVTAAAVSPDPASLHLDRLVQHRFASGIDLLGTDAWPASFPAGQTLSLRLFWQVTGTLEHSPDLSVRLGQTGVRADVAIPAATPAGQVVHTYADLRLPPDLPAADYKLQIVSADELAQVTLGSVIVTNRTRLFAAPSLALAYGASFGNAVRLLGVANAAPALSSGAQAGQTAILIAAGQSITLTLVWQALATPQRDLVRFVHVLGADGRPIAQEDGQPCAGGCPATSWLVGEVLVEQARITLPADLPEGSYRLAVGWYDSVTFQRLPSTSDMSSGVTPDEDIAPLPVTISVRR